MPVKFMRVPVALRAAFLKAARDLFYKETALLADLRANPRRLFCLPVYTLSSDALLAGASLDAAQPAGFRLLYLSPEFVLAADSPPAPDGPPAIASLSHSPKLRETVEFVLNRIEEAGIAPSVSYRACLLRISSSYLEACWLQAPAGKPDLLIPTVTALKQVKARGISEPNLFLSAARSVATRNKESGGNKP